MKTPTRRIVLPAAGEADGLSGAGGRSQSPGRQAEQQSREQARDERDCDERAATAPDTCTIPPLDVHEQSPLFVACA